MGASFIGRERDLEALRDLVRADGGLVSVLGPAGIGKTRLTAELCRLERSRFDAVWFCDLSEARGGLAICGAIAREVGASLDGSDSLERALDTLALMLRETGRALLVLDNVEQILEETAVIVEAIGCPSLTLLVTSRERLRVRGEHIVDLDALDDDDAITLFAARAGEVRHGYELGDELGDVRDICRELDGLPLAIELAAARMRVLSAKELRTRLASRFELLTSALRGTSRRHATLRGAIDWSWDLLSDGERAALMQCAVFEGGFSVEAAEAVIELADDEPVIDALQALRDKSLLRLREGDKLRFGLYTSIRDYARDKLEASGGADAVRRRHADHFLAKGLFAAARAEGHRASEARRYLLDERDNLLAVHRRALEGSDDGVDPERALRAAIVVQPLLITGGPAALRLELLDRALETAQRSGGSLSQFSGSSPHGSSTQLVGWAMLARADCLLGLGRLDEARADLERAREAAEQHRDDWLGGRCEWRLGTLHWLSGRPDAASAHVERAVEIFGNAGDDIHVGRALGSLGVLHAARGQHARAREIYQRALALHEARGDHRWVWTTRGRLGELDDAEGKLDEAEARLREAIDGHKSVQNHRHEAQALAALGAVLLERGRTSDARQCFESALALHKRVPDRRAEAACRADLGDALADEGLPEQAAACLEASAKLARDLGNARLEASAMARLVRLQLGRDDSSPDAAAEALDAAIARAAGDDVAAALILLAGGHLQLARDDRDGARDRLAEVTLVKARHAVVRRAAQRLERALEREPPDDVLVVSAVGEWFKPAGAEVVDLRTRRSLRLVLRALVRQLTNHPGDALSTEALFEAGWPGERAQPQAATSRVYVALSTLRKLGLRDALVKREDGYLLDGADLKRWS